MPSSDCDDYMSDNVIKSSSNTRKDISYRKKREFEHYKKSVISNFSNSKSGRKYLAEQRKLETESTKISSSNIGFKMLSKMGYKEGNSLGKSGNF